MLLVTKIDSIRFKRVKITDTNGSVYVGVAFQPCVDFNEDTGEEVDAICIATETNGNMVFTEDDIVDYEILN